MHVPSINGMSYVREVSGMRGVLNRNRGFLRCKSFARLNSVDCLDS